MGKKETPEIVIAVGKLVYRCYKQSPELLAFDSTTLWRVVHDSCGDDGADTSLLTDVRATFTWELAVRTAKVMRELYTAGGLEEEPA